MTMDDRIQQVFREVLGDDELVLTDETTARDIEAWDSLAHINIMFALESEFDVQFNDGQLTSFQNVGELRRYLRESASP
jgi:acyl carrier protein